MREKKLLSSNPYVYETDITVQIDDINYGGHVGNERYLLYAQETRMRFLQTIGHTEIKFGEFGIVVAEAGIEYFAELFHGEIITISISIDNISRVAFDCFYKIEKKLGEKKAEIFSPEQQVHYFEMMYEGSECQDPAGVKVTTKQKKLSISY